MDSIQDIIIDDTLRRMGEERFAGYLCHAWCYGGHAVFRRNGRAFTFQQGDCLIVPRRGDLTEGLRESPDFKVDVVYVTQEFIETATPRSNYGIRGHLALFHNPIMRLTPEQQQRCADNFAEIHRRLSMPQHHFYRDVLINAVQTMILDFFDFHAAQYGFDRISSQYHQLMESFIVMLEQGDFRKNRNLGYYADRLCVTPKYLSEVAKKISGLPAAYWITRYTALDISRMLRDRQYSFSQLADMYGFSSQAHFNRFVQKNLGAKPSDFRE